MPHAATLFVGVGALMLPLRYTPQLL